jgi:hypothetical protein
MMESSAKDLVRLRDEWRDELNSITEKLQGDGLSADERAVVECEKDFYENLIDELEATGKLKEE